MSNMFKLATVNLFLIGSATVGYFYGYVGPLFANDVSRLSYGIAAFIATNILFAFIETWKAARSFSYLHGDSEWMRWMRFNYRKLIYLGLIGSFIGLREIVSGFNSADDPALLIGILKSGAQTLAGTSILGLVAFLWASLNFYLMGDE